MNKSKTLLCILCMAICGTIIGCSKETSSDFQVSDGVLSQFTQGGVLISITKGAPIAPKGAVSSSDYYTITGLLNSTKYSMYVESEKSEDGLLINKVYTQDGSWLYSEVTFDGDYVRSEFAEIDDDLDFLDTKGSRRPGESYIGCVHRVHEKLKAGAEQHNPVSCEFVPCGAISAVIGIIDCGQYGTNFSEGFVNNQDETTEEIWTTAQTEGIIY